MGKRIQGDGGKCREHEGTWPGVLRIAHQDPWNMTETVLGPEVRGKGGNWQEWEIKGTREASKTAHRQEGHPACRAKQGEGDPTGARRLL